MILNNLGSTAKAQDEPAEARTFLVRALGIFRDNLGQDHPYTTITEEHLDTLPRTQLPQETVDDDYVFYF